MKGFLLLLILGTSMVTSLIAKPLPADRLEKLKIASKIQQNNQLTFDKITDSISKLSQVKDIKDVAPDVYNAIMEMLSMDDFDDKLSTQFDKDELTQILKFSDISTRYFENSDFQNELQEILKSIETNKGFVFQKRDVSISSEKKKLIDSLVVKQNKISEEMALTSATILFDAMIEVFSSDEKIMTELKKQKEGLKENLIKKIKENNSKVDPSFYYKYFENAEHSELEFLSQAYDKQFMKEYNLFYVEFLSKNMKGALKHMFASINERVNKK